MGLLNSIKNTVKDNFTNTSFEIENTMQITELSKKFHATFGCSLRIYKGKALADGRMTIKTLDARTSKEINKTAGKLTIKATEKVGDIEKKFSDHFGLTVQIADKNNSKLVSNEMTLGDASRL